MTIRIVAASYIGRGWQVVPLVQGAKKADTSWPNKTYAETDFAPDSNIAVKLGDPSGGLVDVDCDCPAAVRAAMELLPTTGLVFGRVSNPNAHYLFVCPGIQTVQFTDGSKMLVEVRSTGGYTMFPPSVHPSGEHVAWTREGVPMTIAPDDLYASVRDVALVALVVEHWTSLDHASMGHLAGFWLRGGLDSTVVKRLFRVIASIADPSVEREIVKLAESTAAKYTAGERVTGGAKLSETLSDKLVSKMRGWLKMADTDALEQMNERHFWVRVGKDDCIGRETANGVIFQRPKALYTEYANRQIVVGQDDKGRAKLKPLFPHWLEWEHRRSYDEVVIAPPPLTCGPRDYNLWSGPAIEPKAGDCSRILEHMHEVLCSGNDEHYRYLTKLCAALVQFPGLPWEIAVVLRGPRGAGKGTFMRVLERIVGRRHFAHLDRVSDLVGFNAMISGKIVVFADEAFFAGDKREIGTLQRLITEPTIRVTRKGIDSHEERNCIHLVMATNEDWSAPAGAHERRYFALNVSNKYAQNKAWFTALHAQITSGGDAAFLHDMLQVPVTPDDIRTVPRTAELARQQWLTMDAHFKWWYECLNDGTIGDVQKPWGEKRSTDAVHKAYLAYAEKQRIGRPLDKTLFTKTMGEYLTGATPPTVVHKGERCWKLRELHDARRTFDRLRGMACEWNHIDPEDVSIPFGAADAPF